MKRAVWFLICVFLGLVMLVFGLLVPAHLRAVDSSVIEQAGRDTPSFTERGLALVGEKKLGAAQLYVQAAQARGFPGREQLSGAVDELAAQHPDLIVLGHDEPGLKILFGTARVSTNSRAAPFTDFVVRQENRQRAIGLLSASANPVVQELLRFRAITNTAIFSPSPSASGQALDAAVSVCGLLLERGQLTTGLSN